MSMKGTKFKTCSPIVYILLNLVMILMCFYLYWHWTTNKNQTIESESKYDLEIYNYNRGINETKNVPINGTKRSNVTQKLDKDFDLFKLKRPRFVARKKRHKRQTTKVALVTDMKPRFLNLQTPVLNLNDVAKYKCNQRFDSGCQNHTETFKRKLLLELNRYLMKESDVFHQKNTYATGNPYNVTHTSARQSYDKKTLENIICELKHVHMRSLVKRDGLNKKYFPKRRMFHNERFNSCAIISSAGSLKNSNLGAFIDSHDLVLRFNNAPVIGYERDVGGKTTVRMVNSQVASKGRFHFTTAPLFRNVSVVIWDPSRYNATLHEWFDGPEYDFKKNLLSYKRLNKKGKVYVLDPQALWRLWDVLQGNFLLRLRKNPPSSGFTALALLLNHCNHVDMIEYMPSTRLSEKCYYYDHANNPSCTFGAWHPLAAEKLIALKLNQASDFNVFQNGVLRIPGFLSISCL